MPIVIDPAWPKERAEKKILVEIMIGISIFFISDIFDLLK
jgi:hypothetical protein